MALPSENLQFWEKRWEEGKTAWHKNIVDPVLEVSVLSNSLHLAAWMYVWLARLYVYLSYSETSGSPGRMW